jgi:uncharacterized protein YggE
MSGKMQDIDSKLVMILMAVLGIALLASLLVRPMQFSTGHTITVTASGIAKAVPDEVQVSMYANGTGASAGSAAANLSSTLTALNSTLTGYVNGNYSNITTESYTLTRINASMPYVATEYLQVTVNANRISSLLGELSNMSNVYIDGEYTGISPAQANNLKSEALADAISNATSQARAIAGQNSELTPINITINTYSVYPIYANGRGVSMPSASTNLAFYTGTYEVSGTVTVIFSYGK